MTTAITSAIAQKLPLAVFERIDRVCVRFETGWRDGQRPDLAEYLLDTSEGAERQTLFRLLLELELEYRLKRGETPTADDYKLRFPGHDIDSILADVLRGYTPERATTRPDPAAKRSTSLDTKIMVPGYEILERLGAGGMGIVYKAKHLGLNRLVAIKMIRSGDQASAAERARFHIEAQAAARLQHPNVVQIFEVAEVNQQPYLSMEYVPGQSLAQCINGTPWPATRAARLVETLARTIDEAHRRGIVHRDLKPSNVLMHSAGELPESADPQTVPIDQIPKITDFGLAKLLESDQAQTTTGTFIGSPSYAAPEQAGSHQSLIGPRTDLYALGAILYELLTGRPPFRGATVVETLRQVLDKDPVSPRLLNPAVPADLEAVCLKCLEKHPGQRYACATDLADDLARWQAHKPTHARPPGPLGRALRWCRRHPAATTVATVIVFGLLAVLWQWRVAVTARELAELRRRDAEIARQEADSARLEAVEEADAAREIASFLGGLIEEADPYSLTSLVTGNQALQNPSALDLIHRGARRLADPNTLRGKPLVRAALLDKIGHVYASLGHGASAAPFLIEALELRQKHLPPIHPDLASSLHNVAFLQLTKMNGKRSRDLFTDALAMRIELFGSNSPEAMTTRLHLAIAMVASRDPKAESLLNSVLEFQRKRFQAAQGHDNPSVHLATQELAFALITLSNFYSSQGQLIKALPYLFEAQQVLDKMADKILSNLAKHFIAFRRYQAFGQVDEAAREMRQALAVINKFSSKNHYLYLAFQKELAEFYFGRKRYLEAEKVFLELEVPYRESIGDGQGFAYLQYDIARSISGGSLELAYQSDNLTQYREQSARVEAYARTAFQEAKRCAAEEHVTAQIATFLAFMLLHFRHEPDNVGAEAAAREGLEIRQRLFGVGKAPTSNPLASLILALARQQKFAEVEQVLLDLLARNPNPQWEVSAGYTLPEAARCLASAGKTKAACLLLEQAANAGFYDLEEVRSDPALASLRLTPDFQRLLKKGSGWNGTSKQFR